MKPHPIHLLALKANEQPLELVDPGERTLVHKALFVDGLVKMTLPSTLGMLPIALVFGNIRPHPSVPEHLSSLFGVKRTISVEKRIAIVKSKLVELPENVFQSIGEVVTIIVIAGNDLTCGKDKAICIS